MKRATWAANVANAVRVRRTRWGAAATFDVAIANALPVVTNHVVGVINEVIIWARVRVTITGFSNVAEIRSSAACVARRVNLVVRTVVNAAVTKLWRVAATICGTTHGTIRLQGRAAVREDRLRRTRDVRTVAKRWQFAGVTAICNRWITTNRTRIKGARETCAVVTDGRAACIRAVDEPSAIAIAVTNHGFTEART